MLIQQPQQAHVNQCTLFDFQRCVKCMLYRAGCVLGKNYSLLVRAYYEVMIINKDSITLCVLAYVLVLVEHSLVY